MFLSLVIVFYVFCFIFFLIWYLSFSWMLLFLLFNCKPESPTITTLSDVGVLKPALRGAGRGVEAAGVGWTALLLEPNSYGFTYAYIYISVFHVPMFLCIIMMIHANMCQCFNASLWWYILVLHVHCSKVSLWWCYIQVLQRQCSKVSLWWCILVLHVPMF